MYYINPEASRDIFEDLRRSTYFVDKSGIISALTPYIGVQEKYICITRPRRFGKTTNARMLACFLSRGLGVGDRNAGDQNARGLGAGDRNAGDQNARGLDAGDRNVGDRNAGDPEAGSTGAESPSVSYLFDGLKVMQDAQAMQHMGAHDVIYIDFSKMPQRCKCYDDYLSSITDKIISEVRKMFPDANISDDERDLLDALDAAYTNAGASFCFVMDEWDFIFSRKKFTEDDRQEFLTFLNQLLKGNPYVEFAYMTGIMPIAKNSSGSELNMFDEFNAISDPLYWQYFGFTESEVRALCEVHAARVPDAQLNYEQLEYWYDGYITEDGQHMFNPRSVVLALNRDRASSFWTESGPHEEIYNYIRNNVAAVRDDIVRMVSGKPVYAEMENFAFSPEDLETREEIFSAMVVYGFLTYHDGQVSIPNHELMLKFQKVLSKEGMGYVAALAQRSREMLAATLRGDTSTMTEIIEAAHDQEVPLLRYNNEADLAALVNLVYIAARNYYDVRQEQAAGKGVADVVFTPKNPTSTEFRPFIVELKSGSSASGGGVPSCDAANKGANSTSGSTLSSNAAGSEAESGNASRRDAAAAIAQIRERNYAATFNDALTGEYRFATTPLAVGIAWDTKSKTHECIVEEL